MTGRDNLSNRRNSRAMGQRHHPMRFDTIWRDYFHRGYCNANHSRNNVPLSEQPKLNNFLRIYGDSGL
jgi:hypothetical protein